MVTGTISPDVPRATYPDPASFQSIAPKGKSPKSNACGSPAVSVAFRSTEPPAWTAVRTAATSCEGSPVG
jgi:hypothetical protein